VNKDVTVSVAPRAQTCDQRDHRAEDQTGVEGMLSMVTDKLYI